MSNVALFPAHRSLPSQAGSVEADFEVWWSLCPLKRAKGEARVAYARARKIASADMLIDGLLRYRAHIEANAVSAHFTAHPATWLNGERWEDEYETPVEQDTPAERLDRILKAKCENMNRLGRRFPGVTDAELERAVQEGWLRKELAEKWGAK